MDIQANIQMQIMNQQNPATIKYKEQHIFKIKDLKTFNNINEKGN